VKAEPGSVSARALLRFVALTIWTPISVVGCVKEGGSLAGNESSSSRLRSFSCSLCDSFRTVVIAEALSEGRIREWFFADAVSAYVSTVSSHVNSPPAFMGSALTARPENFVEDLDF
jgi:hypothetical protein